MKTAGFILGGTMIALGLMAIAGSAGDCDGKCMENANPLSVVLLIAVGSLVSMSLGAIMLYKAERI